MKPKLKTRGLWDIEYAHSQTAGSPEFIHNLTFRAARRRWRNLKKGIGLPKGTTLLYADVTRYGGGHKPYRALSHG